MTPELALQRAVRERLIAEAVLPAGSILDRGSRPVADPSIVMGEGQSLEEGDIARRLTRCWMTLHVWKKEAGSEGVKTIAGAIRTALRAPRLVLEDGFHCADARVSSARFLRDPDGETAHGVVTVEALVEEIG